MQMTVTYKIQMDDSKRDLSLALLHAIENLIENFDTVEGWQNLDADGSVLVTSEG